MKSLAGILAAAVVLAGCAGKGDLDETGTGVAAVRSACPTVAVPAATGDVTLFDPADRRDADAIDLAATMTNVRSTCGDQGDQIQTDVTFDVQARRRHTDAARDVTLPYFIVITRGGSAVVAKRVGRVALHFDAGRDRAQASGTATTLVTRAAATLPDDIKKRITEKRKAGQEDAAIDPLSRPEVRAAVLRTSFEALVGFQLTDEQLKYNATR
ncbi:hypothetical protein [uncultured Sphingomonas sp.]|uniref:hypothetical protein n=1 Tax=uncultured Sphingomonas sp. TaxID=158754 RepID=UPI0035CC4E6B